MVLSSGWGVAHPAVAFTGGGQVDFPTAHALLMRLAWKHNMKEEELMLGRCTLVRSSKAMKCLHENYETYLHFPFSIPVAKKIQTYL